MMHPTIHLNGTPRARLFEGYEAAGRAMIAALNALADAAPNARDYYPQGADAYAQANREHHARLTALHQVVADIYTILEGIAQ